MDAFTEHYRSNVYNELVPKIVCSMYLTVPCLSYTSETSSLFPSQKLLLLRQTTGRRKEKDKKTNQRQSAHKECWVRLKINDLPPLFIQSDAFVG